MIRTGIGKAEPFRTSDGKAIYPCLPGVMKIFSSAHKVIEPAAVLSTRFQLRLWQIRIIPAFLTLLLTASFVAAQTNNLQARLENVATLIRDHRIAEAEQQLNGILKAAPNDAAALNLLGTIRAQQGRLNEAETLLTRAAKIDPAFVPAHMNLAFLYMLKNGPEKTISELKEVVNLEPANIEANYKLASLLLSRGQIDDSIGVIEKVKLSPPASVIFLTLRGDAYFSKGYTDKAE